MDPEHRTVGAIQLRVVVDTKVLTSGLLSSRGPAREIIDRWLAGAFTLLTSEQMLSECERILEHPALKDSLGINISPRDDLIAMVRDQAQKIETTAPALMRVVRNPFDGVTLTNAVVGEADYLVTEEDELLDLKEHEGVKIATPEQFLDALTEQPGLPGLL